MEQQRYRRACLHGDAIDRGRSDISLWVPDTAFCIPGSCLLMWKERNPCGSGTVPGETEGKTQRGSEVKREFRQLATGWTQHRSRNRLGAMAEVTTPLSGPLLLGSWRLL
jgi:hypothetical protein